MQNLKYIFFMFRCVLLRCFVQCCVASKTSTVAFYVVKQCHTFNWNKINNVQGITQVKMHHMLNVCDTHLLHMIDTYSVSKKSTSYVLHMMQTHVFHMFFIWIHMNTICFSYGRKQCFSKKRTLYVTFMV
jgi:hypothetical protein